MKLIIDISEEVYESIKNGMRNKDDVRYVMGKVEDCTPILDNATNGDMVRAIFTNTFDDFCERTTWEWNRWWNAPYQKGGKE